MPVVAPLARFLAPSLALILAACAAPGPEGHVQTAASAAQAGWLRTQADQQAAQQDTQARLAAGPLSQASAVHIALRSSPAAQQLLAQGWQRQSEWQELGQAPLPHLSFERLVKGQDTDITRKLGLNLGDWLLWPRRAQAARQGAQADTWRLTRDLLGHAQAVQVQWVRAVAAQQLALLAQRLQDASDAAAQAAQKLEEAGSYTALQRQREALNAAAALAQTREARLTAQAEREALIRLLGLSHAQALALRLPDELPALPAKARVANAEALPAELNTRLDLRWAEAQWQATQGQAAAFSPLGIEGSAITGTAGHGFELALSITPPTQNQGLSAVALAAQQAWVQAQADAASQWREQAQAYRSRYDLAAAHQSQWLPLRNEALAETLRRYNGMLISVFELLAEAREQAHAQQAAVAALRDFWLADIALSGVLQGLPMFATTAGAGFDAAPAVSPTH